MLDDPVGQCVLGSVVAIPLLPGGRGDDGLTYVEKEEKREKHFPHCHLELGTREAQREKDK